MSSEVSDIRYSRAPGYRVDLDLQGDGPDIAVHSGDMPVRTDELTGEEKARIQDVTAVLDDLEESEVPFWKKVLNVGYEEVMVGDEVYQWIGEPDEELGNVVEAIEDLSSEVDDEIQPAYITSKISTQDTF